MDDQDQNWVNKQRKTCKKIVTPVKNTTLKSILKPNPDGNNIKKEDMNNLESKITYADAVTDAILNCPCCMTTLCMDSQRHDKYKTQYRAMFVSNCKINQDELLKYPKEEFESQALNAKKMRKNKSKAQSVSNEAKEKMESKTGEQDFDIFRPVMCQICCTEVGVYEESEEIYHFFNVLTSHS